jgi:hypothetical protein
VEKEVEQVGIHTQLKCFLTPWQILRILEALIMHLTEEKVQGNAEFTKQEQIQRTMLVTEVTRKLVLDFLNVMPETLNFEVCG